VTEVNINTIQGRVKQRAKWTKKLDKQILKQQKLKFAKRPQKRNLKKKAVSCKIKECYLKSKL
jgi:exonuclease III